MRGKVCSRCKEEKPTESFSNDRTKDDGLRRQCKSCDKAYWAGYKKVAHKKDKLRHRVEKLKAIAYKGGKCYCCGYDDYMYLRVFAFHHLDPTKKDLKFDFSKRKFETVKQELDKCILVCSNCHAIIHDGGTYE